MQYLEIFKDPDIAEVLTHLHPKRNSPPGKYGPFSLIDGGENKKLQESRTSLSNQFESIFNSSFNERTMN